MRIELFDYQIETLNKLKSGSILRGGVGSGKSITAIAYYFSKDCGGSISPFEKMTEPKDLYIITTARKRDTLDWEEECLKLLLSKKREFSINNIMVTIDSWNNIGKYENIKTSFFIFDEQRIVGYGAWVKSFLKIAKANHWLLLSATPGDTWQDYIPVFIANGFYKNKAEFIRKHIIFNSFVRYPKIERYVDTWKLIELRNNIMVDMDYKKKTIANHKNIIVKYDKKLYEQITKKRWNIFTNLPIANASELCFVWRRITNSDSSRVYAIKEILETNKKVIIFYNYNYELDILRQFSIDNNIPVAEWNGHKHEMIPKSSQWIYLVQYTSGAEGWNCIETDTMIFYSQNYSYKLMHQAAGRIDRLNTPFTNLYYYHLRSDSKIDLGISYCLKNKKSFNETDFVKF
jgi:hypothetical protein